MNERFSAYHVLADLLMALQIAMQEGELWDCEVPSQTALQSIEPFCIDTMTFEQWLKFVMMERFKLLLASGEALPARCHIAPMAEEAFKNKPKSTVNAIVKCLNQLDQHLSEQV